VTRTARLTYSGNGYGAGYREGERADLGTTRVGRDRGRSLAASGQ
jgi:hypothetical protein